MEPEAETIEDLFEALARTPNELRSLVASVPAEHIRTKPTVEEFSALEQACHLRDLEIEGYGLRIQRMLSEQSPRLSDFDGTRLAIERSYNTQELDIALREFSQARERNVATLKNLTHGQLGRVGILQGVGEVTISQLAAMMYDHDVSHIEELEALQKRLART